VNAEFTSDCDGERGRTWLVGLRQMRALLCAATVLVTLLAPMLLQAQESRREGQPGGVTAGARVIPCKLATPVTSLMRKSKLERRWKEVEKELEQPMRAWLADELVPKAALESLDQRVLGVHRWTLTRYLVRVLRELEAPDLVSADQLLRLDAYAEHALSDAMWDGHNGWDVVSTVRAETLQILGSLEQQARSGSGEHGDDDDEAATPGVGQKPAVPPERVVERLLAAAAEREPYFVGSNCEQPRD
jgi:hypothetical protein